MFTSLTLLSHSLVATKTMAQIKASPEPVAILRGHTSDVQTVCFSSDALLAASGYGPYQPFQAGLSLSARLSFAGNASCEDCRNFFFLTISVEALLDRTISSLFFFDLGREKGEERASRLIFDAT